jgi:hypothetical protein
VFIFVLRPGSRNFNLGVGVPFWWEKNPPQILLDKQIGKKITPFPY